MKRSRLRPISKKTGRRRPGRDAARRHVLARTTMAPVGHCEYAAGGPAAREHWGPLDIHHVAKRSQRGTEEPSNLLRLCRRHQT